MIYEIKRSILTGPIFSLRLSAVLIIIPIIGMLSMGLSSSVGWELELFLLLSTILAIAIFWYVLKCLSQTAWKVEIQNDGLIISTVKNQFKIKWESIKAIEKYENQKGKYYAIHNVDGETTYILDMIDPKETLLPELRSHYEILHPNNDDAPKTFSLPWAALGHIILALPFGLYFLAAAPWGLQSNRSAVLFSQCAAVGGILAIASVIAVLMYVCYKVEVSKTGLSVKSLLGRWQFHWKDVSISKNGLLRTPVAVFFLYQFSNFDLLKQDAERFAKSSRSADSPFENQAMQKFSPGTLLWLLAAILLVVPSQYCFFMLGIVVLLGLFDFISGDRSFFRTAFCIFACLLAYWSLFHVPYIVDPSAPAIVRCLEWRQNKDNLLKYVQMSNPERIGNYEMTPPLMITRSKETIPDLRTYVQWFDRDQPFDMPNEVLFRVDEVPKPSSLIYDGDDWEHPWDIKKLIVEPQGGLKQGGMNFSVRRWHGGIRGYHLTGIDYTTRDAGKEVKIRLFGEQSHEKEMLLRAQAVIQSFHKL